MKKILITGAGGYLAGHLAAKLILNNYDVILIDKKRIKKKILGNKIKNLDILKIKNKDNLFKNIKFIFHFAGMADISESNRNPEQAIIDNIIATNILIDKVVKFKIERLFFASTLYVYSKNKGGIYKITKRTCEDLILNASERYNLKYTIMKFGSIYGGNANNFNLIRNLLISGIYKRKIIQNLSGREIRSYIYIDDVIKICADLIKNKFINKNVLISGYETISIKNLINKLENIIKDKIKIKFTYLKNNDHYEKKVFDITPKNLIKIKLNKFITLDEGLKKEYNYLTSKNVEL